MPISERLKTVILNLSYQQGRSIEELGRLMRRPKTVMRDALIELIDEQRLYERHGRRVTTYHTSYLSGPSVRLASEQGDDVPYLRLLDILSRDPNRKYTTADLSKMNQQSSEATTAQLTRGILEHKVSMKYIGALRLYSAAPAKMRILQAEHTDAKSQKPVGT